VLDAGLQTSSVSSKKPVTSEMSATIEDAPNSLVLELIVTDPSAVLELMLKTEGRDRDEYALSALKIGLLSLRHARGQVDADIVRREGEKLLIGLDHALQQYRGELNGNLEHCLREYFDPNSGKFQERVNRLVKQDGDLEQVLRRQIAGEGSELSRTLASFVGKNSLFMKLLDPSASEGLVHTLTGSVEQMLDEERRRIFAELSLDNKGGALSRLISEITEENGKLKGELGFRVDAIVKEFSLDKDDSALSRLVKKVECAQQTITNEFSLDNQVSALSRLSLVVEQAKEAINHNLTLDSDTSALARLRRELVEILDQQKRQADGFQKEVKADLASIVARREEALRSTSHGRQFEDLVAEFIEREMQKSGDVPQRRGNSTGEIKHCKVGDIVVDLGPDSTAAGERFVIEAKENNSCDLSAARKEIALARKNRGASAGLFVFSKKSVSGSLEPLLRCGNDVFCVWDADDLNSDVILRAGISLVKALCIREAKSRDAEAIDFAALDASIIELENHTKRLASIKTWTDTIKSNSGKILDEVRKLADGLEQQIGLVKESVAGLKSASEADR
jgi:hypothetical protein